MVQKYNQKKLQRTIMIKMPINIYNFMQQNIIQQLYLHKKHFKITIMITQKFWPVEKSKPKISFGKVSIRHTEILQI